MNKSKILLGCWAMFFVPLLVNGKAFPRNKDCIGNVGGGPTDSGNCRFVSSRDKTSRDEAITCCESVSFRTAMPGSNALGQAINFNDFVVTLPGMIGDFKFKLWTAMSYNVSQGLYHPAGPIENGSYVWKNGTDLSQDHRCIAAEYDITVNGMIIFPDDCDKQLDFACVSIVAINETCGEGEVISPIYDRQCSSGCIQKPIDDDEPITTNEPTTDSPDTTTPDRSTVVSSSYCIIIACFMTAVMLMTY